MDQICKICKFWSGHVYSDGKTIDGACALFDKDTGESDMANINVETEYPRLIDGIFFNTLAKFGCNQWETKEP